MKTRTVTERIGEYLGPIDWSFDWDYLSRTQGMSQEQIDEGIEFLKQLGDGKGWEIYQYGMWKDVLWVGMYDGWPYWRPMPTIAYKTWLGAEHTSPWSICNIRRKEPA